MDEHVNGKIEKFAMFFHKVWRFAHFAEFHTSDNFDHPPVNVTIQNNHTTKLRLTDVIVNTCKLMIWYTKESRHWRWSGFSMGISSCDGFLIAPTAYTSRHAWILRSRLKSWPGVPLCHRARAG
jgi:hypothetical protein